LSSNAGIERKENYQRLGLQVDTSKFRIVVIASNAGGTGAGSAIDLGWIAKAIARQEVSDSQVDLVMFLPSGYAKANKERTEANAYATLMELETTMRDMNARVQWMDPDSVVGRGAPFDDVYFVDTANLANKATQDVKDAYQMVADTLFEDFASADFANRKRSVAVNQQQHKLGPYNPRVPEQRFGDMRLSYSKVYSAFGQAVLDTQQSLRDDIRAYELAALMVKAFFGLASTDGTAARRATDRSATASCASRWAWGASVLGIPRLPQGHGGRHAFPGIRADRHAPDGQGPALAAGAGREQGAGRDRPHHGLLRPQAVAREGGRAAAQPGARRHPRGRRHRRDQRGPHQAQYRRAAGELRLNVRGRLYMLLDDRKQGGLEFVLSLLEQVKARLASATSPTPSATASVTATSATRCARARSRNR
jgi:hypothetical protein